MKGVTCLCVTFVRTVRSPLIGVIQSQGTVLPVYYTTAHHPRMLCYTIASEFELPYFNAVYRDNRFVSIPFPSAFHWWEGIENLPWAVHMTSKTKTTVSPFSSPTGNFPVPNILPRPPTPVPAAGTMPSEHPAYFAVYLGSTQTLNPAHTKIRLEYHGALVVLV